MSSVEAAASLFDAPDYAADPFSDVLTSDADTPLEPCVDSDFTQHLGSFESSEYQNSDPSTLLPSDAFSMHSDLSLASTSPLAHTTPSSFSESQNNTAVDEHSRDHDSGQGKAQDIWHQSMSPNSHSDALIEPLGSDFQPSSAQPSGSSYGRQAYYNPGNGASPGLTSYHGVPRSSDVSQEMASSLQTQPYDGQFTSAYTSHNPQNLYDLYTPPMAPGDYGTPPTVSAERHPYSLGGTGSHAPYSLGLFPPENPAIRSSQVVRAPSRPTTYNAYDPPIPAMKTSKRSVSSKASFNSPRPAMTSHAPPVPSLPVQNVLPSPGNAPNYQTPTLVDLSGRLPGSEPHHVDTGYTPPHMSSISNPVAHSELRHSSLSYDIQRTNDTNPWNIPDSRRIGPVEGGYDPNYITSGDFKNGQFLGVQPMPDNFGSASQYVSQTRTSLDSSNPSFSHSNGNMNPGPAPVYDEPSQHPWNGSYPSGSERRNEADLGRNIRAPFNATYEPSHSNASFSDSRALPPSRSMLEPETDHLTNEDQLRSVHNFEHSPYEFATESLSKMSPPRSLLDPWPPAPDVNGMPYSHNEPMAPTQAAWENTTYEETFKQSHNTIPHRMVSPPKSQILHQDPNARIIANVVGSPRERSMSNGSASSSSMLQDHFQPYHPFQPQSHDPLLGSSDSDLSGYSLQTPKDAGQEQYMQSSVVHAAYAPSPSLLGTNDPLERTKVKVPLVSFGFGGKLVTCFHSSRNLSTGFDVALSSRQSTDVHIRQLHGVISSSVVESSPASYPGPLFGDPGSPVASVVLMGHSSQVKTKKTKVLKYLDDRAEELSRSLGYLSLGSVIRSQTENKIILVKLLRILTEHDGQLGGSPTVDAAVRAVLLPRLSGLSISVGNPTYPISASSNVPGHPADGYPGAGVKDSPIAIYQVRPSCLEVLQEFLLRGEKRQAYHYALDEKLWAHAMVISSSLDKESFKEVVNEFIKAELGVKHDTQPGPLLKPAGTSAPSTNGREHLRVAYSILSGQAAAAVQELLPPKFLMNGNPELHPTIPTVGLTPISPNFQSIAATTNLPYEVLSKWQESATMILSSQMGPDSSAALTTLGDCLLSNHWIEAAHCCYLLSPLTSPMGGIGTPSARITLVGSQSLPQSQSFTKDEDPIIFSEIAEFALTLRGAVKGQEPFNGFPHLQAYRLVRAEMLAEMGDTVVAKRYCDAIVATSGSRPSPYFTPTLFAHLKELSDRLIGNHDLDKGGSWIGGRIAKPSLDNFSDWLGGRLSKFVAGEGESSPASGDEGVQAINGKEYASTFSHYSTISSSNTSKSPSPAPSITGANSSLSSQPRRSGSAMALRPLSNSQAPIDRASSAMDHLRPGNRQTIPGPRLASAGAFTTTFSQAPSYSQLSDLYGSQFLGASSGGPSAQNSPEDMLTAPLNATERTEQGKVQEPTSWWSSYNDDTNTTPTATTFFKVDSPSSNSGFVSLMDDHSAASALDERRAAPSSDSVNGPIENEDDLGLGNSTTPRKKLDSDSKESKEDTKVEPKPTNTEQAQKPELKSANSGSWLGRWWNRGGSAPGPVKASLGEESSFYYDPELKKWVNKKAGSEPPKPAGPPPPPSRAQTASPTKTTSFGNNSPGASPPPPRPASAVDLSSSPPKKSISRARSNLVPSESEPAVPPSSLTPPPPPPGRPKSSASKRSVRSRYVDVFQQPGAES
ncbi:hypothetical protein BD410DRAFT_818910 [Rickenella mellea]|uniref:Protein transport protein sec16 n=1 Tax=Rickenella mellea TaxID=50990 RepID=A0A4Y7QKR3_9AGAM|nr:hypothetical protein BD410DRAFT_818910 [Rickenella mellea]